MDKNKNDAIKKYKKDTMKLLRWIAPPLLAVLAIAVYVMIVIISYTKVGYGALYLLGIWFLLLPVLPGLYTAKLLKDCKHRICYATYCSAVIAFFPILLALNNIIRRGAAPDKEQIIILGIVFIWCEVWALIVLLWHKETRKLEHSEEKDT